MLVNSSEENEIKFIPGRRTQLKLLGTLSKDPMDRVVSTIGGVFGLTDTFEIIAADAKNLHDVYYDTPDLDLFRSGSCLRVRTFGKNITVTLKLNRRRTDGTFIRDEHSMECDQSILQSLLVENFAEITRGRLNDSTREKGFSHVLIVDNMRRNFSIRRNAKEGAQLGFEAELSFDMFTIKDANGRCSNEMYEIEIEAASSEARRQLDSMRKNMLSIEPSLIPSGHSKYERGVRYLKLDQPRFIQRARSIVKHPYAEIATFVMALVGCVATVLGLAFTLEKIT